MDGQISFTFEQRQPIKGYPELHWTGKRAYETEQFYPAQLKEVYGNPKDGWMNKIFWGDNLQVMGHLLQNFMGKINLVYIDPPFASSADYVKKIKLKKKAVTGDASMFEEKQYTDIWNNDEYLQFIFERLTIIRELLSEQGTIFMHCDWRVSGYVRLIMDEVFGKENFLNEIIWNYSGGRIGHNFFGRKHDTIFWYAKQYGQQTFNYNDVRQEYAESTLKRNQYKNNGSDDRVLDYKPNEDGKFPEDVWNISIINPFAKERLDYPTQKPEKLLEQVIKAASNPGDIVFDCFMGSGTTQAVKLLKRPKEGGYYKFSGNEDLIIMQNSEDSVVVKNKDKSFHADTYVFDSKPELQLFLQLLANEHVKKAYFTGMFTADQTDFYVPYIDPESNRLRKYYPDFLVKMDDGSYLILEVKGDNMIDDPVVKAKGAAAEEVAVESSMKYEMLKGTDIMEGKAKF